MAKIAYELKPRDVLFFRDARPMDVDKSKGENVANVGHGANWPRPDQLFSAVIHTLIRDSEAPEEKWYGSVSDLRVTGPFPRKDGKLYLPMPLDWDMTLIRFSDKGVTDIPDPLTAGFADRCIEKKDYPKWISLGDYARYLDGSVGRVAPRPPLTAEETPDNPQKETLFLTEPRVGTTLDAETGASKRVQSRVESGQYEAEYLRLAKGVTMACEIESEKSDIAGLNGGDVRFGGQGGLVRVDKATQSVCDELNHFPAGKPSCFVRWTLLSPALFMKGWYPNWLNEDGKVMFPAENVARRPGESRFAYRQRQKAEMKSFEEAHLIAARIGDAIAFSGYDTLNREKPTELAVPAGSCYVFECKDKNEAALLFKGLNLKARSDLGEKGFGFGICSYVEKPEDFKTEVSQ